MFTNYFAILFALENVPYDQQTRVWNETISTQRKQDIYKLNWQRALNNSAKKRAEQNLDDFI